MIEQKLKEILPLVQKPARYIGGELNSVVKNKEEVDVRFAFCFPDSYEVGMSHLGMKILYSLLNDQPNYWCERVFAPLPDMEEQMVQNNIPLYGLESLEPIKDFDIIGFTLQYELSFTNILHMLNMAGVDIHAEKRTSLAPLVVAGGPCACNPEPLANFIDLFMLGEGEEVMLELVGLYNKAKQQNMDKKEFLKLAALIPGIYVPSLYSVDYNEDGTIAKVIAHDGAPEKVTKRIIKDMNTCYYPDKFVVPFIEVVHDRVMEEVLRGCIRGCRFCQAGFIYRPFREKSSAVINKQARDLCGNTGYDEVSLSSLSTSDHSQLNDLLEEMLGWSEEEKVNISLPSLRIDSFSPELLEKIAKVRKSGLTFAPEAGTQRLRDVINKNITEQNVMDTCKTAFEGGYTAVKLYFMMGLPTETIEDIQGILDLSQKVISLFYSLPSKPKGKGVNVSVSVATFVPKPFTPFQWEPQDTREMIKEKQKHLVSNVSSKKISLSWNKINVSILEGVLARGDRRICNVIENAWNKGCHFDSWDEHFEFDKWMEALNECGLTPEFYANRKRAEDEIFPWDHLDYGVSKEFLLNEKHKAYEDVTTPHCRIKCSGCSANKLLGGACFETC